MQGNRLQKQPVTVYYSLQRYQCLGDPGILHNSFSYFFSKDNVCLSIRHMTSHTREINIHNYRGVAYCCVYVFAIVHLSLVCCSMFAKLKQKTLEEKAVSPRSTPEGHRQTKVCSSELIIMHYQRYCHCVSGLLVYIGLALLYFYSESSTASETSSASNRDCSRKRQTV